MATTDFNFSASGRSSGSSITISDVPLEEEDKEVYPLLPAIIRIGLGAMAALALIVLVTWAVLGAPSIDRSSELSANGAFGLVAFAFASVGGIAALAALFISYRRQVASETSNELTMLANELSRSEAAGRFAAEEERSRSAAERSVVELFLLSSQSLGAERTPERLAALYALERLGDTVAESRQMIVNLLCATLRATPDTTSDEEAQVRAAAQQILSSKLCASHSEARSIGGSPRSSWHGMNIDLAGAQLHDFRFEGGEVGMANFRRTVFTGSTSMLNTSFADDVNLSGSIFEGDVSFGRVDFCGRANFSSARVNGHANFNGATFAGDADFRRATFDHSISLSNTTFHSSALFDSAIVRGDAVLNKAVYQGDSSFNKTHFVGHVWFTGAQFRAVARFPEARFDGDAAFGGSVLFKERAQFDKALFGRRALFNDSRFEKEISFRGAMFGNSADFREAKFADDARFENATFGNEALFDGAEIEGDAGFSRVRLSTALATEKSSWPDGWRVERYTADGGVATLRYANPIDAGASAKATSSKAPAKQPVSGGTD